MKASQSYRRARLFVAINQSVQSFTKPTRMIPAGLAALALTVGTAPAAMAQPQQLEEIQVTGSRISRTTMETPTPVTTIDASELAAMAPGNLIDSLSQMPQFANNLTPEGVNGGQNSGGSNVNLRGAGTNRTLTLLNGRRVVPSNRFGTVDVNLFPEDLLRSVESVTGGASASYGTDAVAGVVNFILDTDYVGFKTHAQTGMTEYGDGRTWEVGGAFGHEFDNGLHILGSLAAFDQAKISSPSSLFDRDWQHLQSRVTNPDPNGPTEIIRPWVKPTNFSRYGTILAPGTPLDRMKYDASGNLNPSGFNGIGVMDSGCQCYSGPAGDWGINEDSEIQNSFRRYNSLMYADYDFSENTNGFFQAIYSENSTSDQRESITFQSTLWQTRVYADNAFLSPQVRDMVNAAGLPYVTYGLTAEDSPDTPLGESRQETNNEMYSLTAGFSHDFDFGWDLNGYYQYGRNVQDFKTVNGVRTDRVQLAMDAVVDPATGQIVCRVNLPQFTGPISQGGNGGLFSDCAPLNTFGGIRNASQAAADYVMDRDDKIARQWTDQHVFELVTSGTLFDGFGAGPVDAAFGVSYRKEELEQRTLNPSDEYPAQVNGTLLSDLGIHPEGFRGLIPEGSTVAPGYNGLPGLRYVPNGYLGDGNSSSVLFSSLRENAGGYNVKEAFTEFNWPLLSNLPGIDMLEVNTAARWADYSGSGDIWAWKFSGNWTINDELRIRATRSRDVRAASLRERYDLTRGGATVNNPWDNNARLSTASTSGGNPNATPEEADTTTAGIVYQPNWLDGLSTSIDWYSIDIQGALAQLGNQDIVDNCFRGEMSMCAFVITPSGAVTNPTDGQYRAIDRVERLFVNLDNLKISGVDAEVRYRTDVDFFSGDSSESLALRFLASYLDENSRQTPGGMVDDLAGYGSLPHMRANTNLIYDYNNYSLFLQGRWIGSAGLDRTRLESNTPVPLSVRPADSVLAACGVNVCTIDNNSLPSVFYMDARLTGRFGADENLEVYANVQNLLDRDPIISPGSGVGRTGVGLGALYDDLGRRYTIGVNYEF